MIGVSKQPLGASHRLDVEQPWQVYSFTRKWGCSEAELRAIVLRVGDAVIDVNHALSLRK